MLNLPGEAAIIAVATAVAELAKLGQTPQGQLTIQVWREDGQAFLEAIRRGGEWIESRFKESS